MWEACSGCFRGVNGYRTKLYTGSAAPIPYNNIIRGPFPFLIAGRVGGPAHIMTFTRMDNISAHVG